MDSTTQTAELREFAKKWKETFQTHAAEHLADLLGDEFSWLSLQILAMKFAEKIPDQLIEKLLNAHGEFPTRMLAYSLGQLRAYALAQEYQESCVAATRELLYKLLRVRAFTVTAHIRACIDKETELYWLRHWFQGAACAVAISDVFPAAEAGSACRDEVTDG